MGAEESTPKMPEMPKVGLPPRTPEMNKLFEAWAWQHAICATLDSKSYQHTHPCPIRACYDARMAAFTATYDFFLSPPSEK